MSSSPTMGKPDEFRNAQRAAPPLERLRGRWRCSVRRDGHPSGMVAGGVLDLLHAGCYLVGSARPGTPPPGDPHPGEAEAEGSPVVEGSVFGAVEGDRIVFWITNRSGSAIWVLEGRMNTAATEIEGRASYTDANRAGEAPLEARFSLARL